MGRIIAAVTMFAAIGFLWTFVEPVGSSLVTRKVREANKQQQKEERAAAAAVAADAAKTDGGK